MDFLKRQFYDLSSLFWIFFVCLGVILGVIVWSSHEGFWGGALSFVAAFCGIMYALFAGEGKFICFIFGIIYCLCYGYLAYQERLFGDVMLNALYLPINFFGMYFWIKNQNQARTKITIISIGMKAFLLFVLLTLAGTAIYGYYLDKIGSNFAYLNAFTTLAQLIAFYLQIRRYWENYVLVSLANIVSVYIWIVLFSSSVEHIAQLINAIVFLAVGVFYLYAWKRQAQ